MYKELEKIIPDTRIKYDEPMSLHTTAKIGGKADVLVMPESIDEIVNIISFARKNSIPVTVIGNGSKIIVSDDGIEGIVIKIGHKMSNIVIEGEYIYAEAGATMPAVAIKAQQSLLSGFEFACGIPGTIGGGIKMNAGAYDGEIKNTLVSCQYLDENLNIVVAKNEDLKFGYRDSIFAHNPNLIVLTAVFKLTKADAKTIDEKMKKNIEARKAKQPLEYPNAGSTFRRPEGYFVGKLIDDAGLRGYCIGSAEVSTKHTGFIINKGGATCEDVYRLVSHIQKVVKEKFNVFLKPELEFMGRNIKKGEN